MTKSELMDAPVAFVQEQDEAPCQPTRDEVITQVMHEANCGLNKATGFVDSMQACIAKTIAAGEDAWLPSQRWLNRFHHVLVTIAPDRELSRPGTAHAALEAYILDPAKGQLALTHDMGTVNEATYCYVNVTVHSFS